jgi:hypothetical protein
MSGIVCDLRLLAEKIKIIIYISESAVGIDRSKAAQAETFQRSGLFLCQ